MPVETEVKIAVPNLDNIRRRLRYLGYRVHVRRMLESNAVLDTADHRFRGKGQLLRLRRVGRSTILTFKDVAKPGRHKSREELETSIEKGDVIEEILARMGYELAFRYDKYRTEYMRHHEPGKVTVDETPIGNYIELEGAPEWIDEAARELGFCPEDYITKSYGTLYLEYCQRNGKTPANMVFSQPSPARSSRKR